MCCAERYSFRPAADQTNQRAVTHSRGEGEKESGRTPAKWERAINLYSFIGISGSCVSQYLKLELLAGHGMVSNREIWAVQKTFTETLAWLMGRHVQHSIEGGKGNIGLSSEGWAKEKIVSFLKVFHLMLYPCKDYVLDILNHNG